MNQFSNDKVFFHTEKLLSVLDGAMVSPSVYEISLSGECNCACTYCCCRNFHSKGLLTVDDVSLVAEQIAMNEGKAVVLTGGGEPLMNPSFTDAVRIFHSFGLSVGIISNGLGLTEEMIPEIVRCASFFRASLDTVDEAGYKQMRGAEPDFAALSANLTGMVQKKSDTGSQIRIGAQIVYMNQPVSDILHTVEFCRCAGIDFIQIRPVDNVTGMSMTRSYGFYQENREALIRIREEFSDSSFEVILNDNKFREYYNGKVKKTYSRCFGANFTASIGHDMHLYFCCSNIGNPAFDLGSIREKPLHELLSSGKRKVMMEYPSFQSCQAQCRNHVLNGIIGNLMSLSTEKARELVREKTKEDIPMHAEFL